MNRVLDRWGRLSRLLAAAFVLAGVIGGCAPKPAPPDLTQATREALLAEAVQTVTARAGQQKQPATPAVPVTAAATTAAPQVATPVVTNEDGARSATSTAQAEAPIRAELARYGVDASTGRLAWVHPPLTVQVKGFNDFKASSQFPDTEVADFVLAADITWNTQFGDSSCGFVFRSDGLEAANNQYLIGLSRYSNGQAIFDVVANGAIVNTHALFPGNKDPAFNAEQDSTNRLVVVGRGTKFQVYTNGALVGAFDPDIAPSMPPLPKEPTPPGPGADDKAKKKYQQALAIWQQEVKAIKDQYARQLALYNASQRDFPQGRVGLAAITQSGAATCAFSNAWLWELGSGGGS